MVLDPTAELEDLGMIRIVAQPDCPDRLNLKGRLVFLQSAVAHHETQRHFIDPGRQDG